MIPRPLDAVMFDMDGLLLDTEAVHRETMAESAAALGLDWRDEVFLKLIGVHRDANNLTLRAHYGDDFPLDAFYDDSDRRFAHRLVAAIPLRPGVLAILDHLAADGVPRALVTSTASPTAEERLRRAGLIDRFDAIVTRSDVANPKPAPDPYLLAAERLAVRPAHCVALEDSHNGVRAAAAAGMATIMVPDLLGPTDETRGLTVATLDSLDAVRTLLIEARGSGPNASATRRG